MKTARKLTSLLLALLLVFALAATAAADDTSTPIKGSITVDNPRENLTYIAYKIFDVVFDDAAGPQHFSYTIDSTKNTNWFNTVKTYAEAGGNGLTLTKVTDTTTYVVTFEQDKFSAPSFAAALKNALTDGSVTDTGSELTTEGTSVSVHNLDLGYYFVKSNDNDALCNLTTTNPSITIHDKNDVPFKKEGVEKNDVEVGQVLDYKITGKVPDYTGFKTYTYAITDTMSKGLTLKDGTLKVMVGNENVTNTAAKCKIEKGSDSTYTFKVTIFVKECKIGDKIEVSYKAVVNEEAVAEVSTNKAVLVYSTNPSTTDTGKIESEHKVYSAKITIDKYWMENQTEHKLADVGFKLYKKETAVTGGAETIKYYVKNETTDAVTWDTDIKKATEVKTDDNGAANFTGLANDTYYLVESTTPAGFNPLTKVETITINGSDTGTGLTENVRVENKTGAVLPSTGGMGTTVFYVLGAVLVLGAGVLLVTKKRMSRNEG